MSAWIIFRVQFKTQKDYNWFKRKYKDVIKILVEDCSISSGVAWRLLWKSNTILFFYYDTLGYGEPNILKKELKGRIKYFDWIPINDLNARWNKDKK